MLARADALSALAEEEFDIVVVGDSFIELLRFDPHTEQTQGGRSYRVDTEGPRFVVMRRDGDGPWNAQYRFDLTPYEYADYAEMCRYHQTSPQSHFTRGRICSRATREGRVTISGTRLIVTTDDWRQEWELRSEKDYVEALRDRFGILLPS